MFFSLLSVFLGQEHCAVITVVNDKDLCCYGITGPKVIFVLIWRPLLSMDDFLSTASSRQGEDLKVILAFHLHCLYGVPQKVLQPEWDGGFDAAGNIALIFEHTQSSFVSSSMTKQMSAATAETATPASLLQKLFTVALVTASLRVTYLV
jgi:hypothetical protein